MAHGFKDDNGIFHPTGNNGKRSSRAKSTRSEGMAIHGDEGENKSEYENYEFKEGDELVSVNELEGYNSADVPDKYDAWGGHALTIFKDNLGNQLSFHDLRNLHHQHQFYLDKKKKMLDEDDNKTWKHIGIRFEIINTSKGSVYEFFSGRMMVDNVTLEQALEQLEDEYGKNLVRINNWAKNNEDDPRFNMREFMR